MLLFLAIIIILINITTIILLIYKKFAKVLINILLIYCRIFVLSENIFEDNVYDQKFAVSFF